MMAYDPYAPGVLQPDVHDRLVANLHGYAEDAMIAPHWICEPLAATVSAPVVDWVRQFRSHVGTPRTGLCLVGQTPHGASPESKCAAIAGALVRNFIRARVFTAGQVIDLVEKHHAPEATCLVVPNLYSGKSAGAALASWKVAVLLDALLERHLRGQQTVIWVSDLKGLTNDYGSGFRALVDNHYVQLEG